MSSSNMASSPAKKRSIFRRFSSRKSMVFERPEKPPVVKYDLKPTLLVLDGNFMNTVGYQDEVLCKFFARPQTDDLAQSLPAPEMAAMDESVQRCNSVPGSPTRIPASPTRASFSRSRSSRNVVAQNDSALDIEFSFKKGCASEASDSFHFIPSLELKISCMPTIRQILVGFYDAGNKSLIASGNIELSTLLSEMTVLGTETGLSVGSLKFSVASPPNSTPSSLSSSFIVAGTSESDQVPSPFQHDNGRIEALEETVLALQNQLATSQMNFNRLKAQLSKESQASTKAVTDALAALTAAAKVAPTAVAFAAAASAAAATISAAAPPPASTTPTAAMSSMPNSAARVLNFDAVPATQRVTEVSSLVSASAALDRLVVEAAELAVMEEEE